MICKVNQEKLQKIFISVVYLAYHFVKAERLEGTQKTSSEYRLALYQVREDGMSLQSYLILIGCKMKKFSV